MGDGRASASVRPDESTALPPLPSYDLPLWNEHSKDKLQGVLTRKGSLAKHVKHQEKAFGPFLPCVKDQIAAFQAESEKGMESFARIGRCLATPNPNPSPSASPTPAPYPYPYPYPYS